MTIINLRPVQRRRFNGEDIWFDLFEQLGPVSFARAFIKAGESASRMSTVNLWLECQRGDTRLFSDETASNCRKVLDRHTPAEISKLASPG